MSDLLVSWGRGVTALQLLSGAGQRFSTSNAVGQRDSLPRDSTSQLSAVVVERILDEPEDDPEHCVADRRLAEGSTVGGELRQLFAGRVVAVDQRGHRP